MKRYVLLPIILFCFTLSNVEAKEHLFVISGVVVTHNSTKKIENFVRMIQNRSGYALKVFYAGSYAKLSHLMRDNPDALGWTCGAPYVEDNIKDSQQLIAVPLFHGSPTYSSFIVTRKDNHKKSLTEFKSKIFVYSDPRSNSGYVAPAVLLKEKSYNIDNFFRVKIVAGIHENSIKAIYRGLADVGSIDEYVWDVYTKKHPEIKKKLHVIQKLGPFPFTPIVAGKNVSKQTISKIQKALLRMNKKELQQFKKDFFLDGFVVKTPSFYEPIKKNLIKIGVLSANTSLK